MEALDLYKYISKGNIEWRYNMNGDQEDVIIFPPLYEIESFYQLLDPTIFDDNGISIIMKDGYFAIWMNDICEYYGIELEKVFERENESV